MDMILVCLLYMYIIMLTLSYLCSVQGLRRHLLEELDQAFPDEVESYREIRAASASVSIFS